MFSFQDDALKYAVQIFGSDWKSIAQSVGMVGPNAEYICQKRWLSVVQPSMVVRSTDSVTDNILVSLMRLSSTASRCLIISSIIGCLLKRTISVVVIVKWQYQHSVYRLIFTCTHEYVCHRTFITTDWNVCP